MKEDDSQRRWLRSLGLFSIIVSELLGFTGAGIGLGYLAWKKLGAPVWTVMILGMVGLGISMFRLNRMSQREMND